MAAEKLTKKTVKGNRATNRYIGRNIEYSEGSADRSQIMAIPRICFAHLPTPVEALPRLSETLGGPRLLIKRDDQTGLAFGGNKTRKLEFLVEFGEENASALIKSLEKEASVEVKARRAR